MDRWDWEQLEPWLQVRAGLPVGALFCVLRGPTCGRPCSPAGIRTLLRNAARAAGVRRRFAPHQLSHAHAVEMSREGVPLVVIQRQLGHADLGITSAYLRGIDNTEIIHTVHERPAPMIPATNGLLSMSYTRWPALTTVREHRIQYAVLPTLAKRASNPITEHRVKRLLLDRCDTLSVFTRNRLAATLEVLSPDVRPGDTLRYRINNTGSIALICGLGYRLERKTAEGWVLMNPGMAFRAIGFGVLPDESRELRATVPAD